MDPLPVPLLVSRATDHQYVRRAVLAAAGLFALLATGCREMRPLGGVTNGGAGGLAGTNAAAGAGGGGRGGTGGAAPGAGGTSGAVGTGQSGSGGGGAGAGTGGTGSGTGGIVGSTAGTGGAGTGGTGGSTATDGGAGDAGAAFVLPACLRDLFASCETNGPCQSRRDDAGAYEQVCFASGVRAVFTRVPNERGCNGAMSVTQVFKADGSPCYSWESLAYPETLCERSTVTWRDAAGLVVATGTVIFAGGTRIDVSCRTEVASCLSPLRCCALSVFGTVFCGEPSCAAGSCP